MTAPKIKSKKSLEYIPSATSVNIIDSSEGSTDIDRNSPVEANFSDDNEDDDLNSVAQNSKLKAVETDTTTTLNTSGGQNFDLVNMILTESKMCNSLMNAASARKESQFKTNKTEKSSKSIKTKSTLNDSQKTTGAKNTSKTSGKPSKKKPSSTSSATSSNKPASSAPSSKEKAKDKSKTDKHNSDSKIKIRVVKVENPKTNNNDSKKGDSSNKRTLDDKTTASKSSKSNKESSENSKTTPKDCNTKKTKSTSETKRSDKSLKKEHSSHKSGSTSKHKSQTDKITSVKKKLPKADGDVTKDKPTKDPTEIQPPAATRESPLKKMSHNNKMLKCSSEGETSGSSPFISEDLDTDLDEHDTYEECLRIFNEYVPEVDHDSAANVKKVQILSRNLLSITTNTISI